MATTAELTARIKRRLTRTQDTAIDAVIADEFLQAKEDLENEPLLPNFLVALSSGQVVTSETFDLGSLTRFLRLTTDIGSSVLFEDLTNTDEPQTPVRRFDDFELLKQRHPGQLEAGGNVVGYHVINNLVYFRPRPTVSVPQTVFFRFYQRALDAATWAANASGLLMAQTGFNVAEYIRDQAGLQYFTQLLARERSKLIRVTQAQLDADQDYVMGDD